MNEWNKLFLVGEQDGVKGDFNTLISMMNYVRYTTLEAIKDITVEELDYLHSKAGNSIGMLLTHMAGVEYWYQLNTFENRDLNSEEEKKWLPGLDLDEGARESIKGNDANYYINLLNSIREDTYLKFNTLSDEWLHEQTEFGSTKATNYFKWFHVFEDEINHRGQIRMIRKLYKNS
ncbi:DinB family protein [Bacillus sp. AFS041924]|uniref:DinB family protein n=1 Tax=Bacillus sp. AFS041924 TaxID=2033503 RepID=UPI000BFDFE49|nr:DinB family protein [Bacillus sp. AFS041924]PGS54182.1 integrase [Bacillus sp. AFS041924]